MSRRKRLALVEIAGSKVRIDAPGLKQIKRKAGIELYWAKRESPLFADYVPATVRIHVDLSGPNAVETIKSICRREQAAMELWLESKADTDDRLRPKFNGTIGSL
jgi:hypothetical protein